MEGIVPTAIPARDAASTSAVVAVVAGRNVGSRRATRWFGFGVGGVPAHPSTSVGDARFGFVSVSVAPVGAFAAIRAGGVSAVDASHVALFAAPRVDASDPSAGPATGGTLVVVVGADFRRLVDDEYPAVASVEFEGGSLVAGRSSVALRAVSSAVAFAETPASGYDVASVRVVASMGPRRARGRPRFHARRHPPMSASTSTTPSTGPDEGGSLVAARGVNLGGAAPLWCRFGTVGPIAARRAVVEGDAAATEARCLSPAGARRVVDVAVSDNKRDRSAAASGSQTTTFAFVTPARAFAVMPPATVAGGGGVFAPGRGVSVFFESATSFVGVSGCGYGAGTSSRGAVVDERIVADAILSRPSDTGSRRRDVRTRLECLTAPDPFIEGFFPILAEGLASGGLGRAAPQFAYVAAPHIAAWAPDVAHVPGGAIARLTGADFLGGGGGSDSAASSASFASLTCVFATGPRSGGAVSGFAPSAPVAVAVSSALVACETPSGLPEGIASLTVTLAGSAGLAHAGGAAPIAIVPAPTVSDMHPTFGATEGGGVVVVSAARRARGPPRTTSPRASDPSRPSRFDRARARGARSSSRRRVPSEETSCTSRDRPRTRSPSRRRRTRIAYRSSRGRRRRRNSPPPPADAFASSPRAARCRRRSRRSRRT